MWSEVRPDFVKIDRHFIHGIADDRMKFHFVRAMQDIAEISAAQIVAEGIEREEDFNLLRDMGIACGQGFFLARPAAVPPSRPTTQAMAALEKARIALSPVGALGGKPVTAEALLRPIEPVSPDTLNERVIDLFKADAQLDVLPVVQDGNPLGLINRYTILDRFARPFTHELFGRRSCTQFMDPAPMVVDHLATVQEISLTLARSEKHHLFDGFIITAGGRYRGVGSSHDLMAMITEMQISAARYSNPLTHLPGNVPINEHIDRLLENRVDFVACYADIDNFKPYNDTFGYREGDEIIQGLSRLVREHCDARLDFVGHIGGDDFFVLFQSRDWEVRCRNLVNHFTAYIETLLGPSIKAQGGFVAEAQERVAREVRLPPGYRLLWSGQFENQVRATARMQILVPVCLLIMFVMLYLGFSRWWIAPTPRRAAICRCPTSASVTSSRRSAPTTTRSPPSPSASSPSPTVPTRARSRRVTGSGSSPCPTPRAGPRPPRSGTGGCAWSTSGPHGARPADARSRPWSGCSRTTARAGCR